MDFNRACKIFGFDIKKSFTYKELKQKYYKLALKYHPDHNPNDITSTERFQELYSAYDYLCNNYINIERKDNCDEDNIDTNTDYFSLFKRYLFSEYNIDITKFNLDTTSIVNECKMASFKIFEKLDKKTALNIFTYMEEYSDIVGIDDNIKTDLKNILREKIKDDECIVLHSTIDNLFNADIYKLNYNDTTFCVPLWHDEVTYELSNDNFLVVKCNTDLPEHIKIDHYNNIHLYIKVVFSTLFKRDTISVHICNDKIFEIPVNELRIIKHQVYTFYRMGIPMINTDNIFSTEKKGNVCIHVEIIE
jgi:hypothetical protein